MIDYFTQGCTNTWSSQDSKNNAVATTLYTQHLWGICTKVQKQSWWKITTKERREEISALGAISQGVALNIYQVKLMGIHQFDYFR